MASWMCKKIGFMHDGLVEFEAKESLHNQDYSTIGCNYFFVSITLDAVNSAQQQAGNPYWAKITK